MSARGANHFDSFYRGWKARQTARFIWKGPIGTHYACWCRQKRHQSGLQAGDLESRSSYGETKIQSRHSFDVPSFGNVEERVDEVFKWRRVLCNCQQFKQVRCFPLHITLQEWCSEYCHVWLSLPSNLLQAHLSLCSSLYLVISRIVCQSVPVFSRRMRFTIKAGFEVMLRFSLSVSWLPSASLLFLLRVGLSQVREILVCTVSSPLDWPESIFCQTSLVKQNHNYRLGH